MRLFLRLHLAACCTLALIAGPAAAQQPNLAKGHEAPRVKQGYKIAPVKLKKRGLDPDLVGLGSYLVNAAGGCNDCHSIQPFAEGGNPYEGQPMEINDDTYLSGGRPFGPEIVSPNLTPDAKGRPAGLTYKKFFNAIRHGKDPDDGHILQIMPWPVFSNLTDRDTRAIYEYLRAIPSLDTPTVTPPDPLEPQEPEPEVTEPEPGLEVPEIPEEGVPEPEIPGEVTDPDVPEEEIVEPGEETGEPADGVTEPETGLGEEELPPETVDETTEPAPEVEEPLSEPVEPTEPAAEEEGEASEVE